MPAALLLHCRYPGGLLNGRSSGRSMRSKWFSNRSCRHTFGIRQHSILHGRERATFQRHRGAASVMPGMKSITARYEWDRPADQECSGVHSLVRTLTLTHSDFLAKERRLGDVGRVAQPAKMRGCESAGYCSKSSRGNGISETPEPLGSTITSVSPFCTSIVISSTTRLSKTLRRVLDS
jgi:hypothetical protein